MDHLVEPDDGGVVQQLHHLHLALHLLQVHRVQLRLVDDLDRDLKGRITIHHTVSWNDI